MSEQVRLPARNALQPVPCPPPMTSQTFELPIGPSRQIGVNVTERGIKGGRIEPSVVVDPTSNDRVEHSGQIIERLVTAQIETPSTHLLPDRLQRLGRYCRTERDPDFTAL